MKTKTKINIESTEVDMTISVAELSLKYIEKQSHITDINELLERLSTSNHKDILFVWLNIIKPCVTYKLMPPEKILENDYSDLGRKMHGKILDRCKYTVEVLRKKTGNFLLEYAILRGTIIPFSYNQNMSCEKVHARFGTADDLKRSFEELTMKFFNKRYSLPNNIFFRCMENRQAPMEHRWRF